MVAPAEQKELDARIAPTAPDGGVPYLRTFTHLSGYESLARPPRWWRRYALASIAIVLLVESALVVYLTTNRDYRFLHDLVFARSEAPPKQPGLTLVSIDPSRRSLRLRIGEAREFAAVAGEVAVYRWTLDKRIVSTDPRWTYRPRVGKTGRRRVVLTAWNSKGMARRHWTVSVRSARPPRILTALHAPDALELAVGERLPIKVLVQPATEGEKLSIAWTLNGKPAGNGDAFVLTPRRAGTLLVRAEATTDLGAQVAREWRVTVVQAIARKPRAGKQIATRTPEKVRRGRSRGAVRGRRRDDTGRRGERAAGA
jgi:hypothetical protein